jgi:hypothetical protein
MEKSMVSPWLRGGLGNYIFQITAAYATSIRDNKDLVVDISDISVIHEPIETYFKNIFRKIKFVSSYGDYSTHDSMQPIQFSEIPSVKNNIKLLGYYQNEKYFKHLHNEISKLYEIDEETLNYLNSKYSAIIGEDTCSLHVRRGSYLSKSDFHPIQTIDYYKEAISIIGEDKLFIIFSDDIDWCVNNLNFIKNKTFISGNLDFQDLYLMSMCKHNIIANSTFSWWGAWLNNNKDKKIIYPSKWFGVSFLDTSEIGCQNWIKL